MPYDQKRDLVQSKPLVSICCITYNQEKFIEEAINSFLSQVTKFDIEILLYDDASTDQTPLIIKKIAEKHPEIIHPIYSKVNTYSKGIKNNPTFNFKRAKGEYIALCEGDDYWIDKNKLQKQVDLLRKHEELDICFHPAYEQRDITINKKVIFSNFGNKVKKFSLREVIAGGGGFMPTQSILIKAKAAKKMPEHILSSAPVGDYYIQIFCSSRGGAIFVPDVMSIYRKNVFGSWSSSKHYEKTTKQRLSMHHEAMKKTNIFLGGEYTAEFKKILYKDPAWEHEEW